MVLSMGTSTDLVADAPQFPRVFVPEDGEGGEEDDEDGEDDGKDGEDLM